MYNIVNFTGGFRENPLISIPLPQSFWEGAEGGGGEKLFTRKGSLRDLLHTLYTLNNWEMWNVLRNK